MLKNYAGWCQDQHLLTRNPVAKIKAIQIQNKDPRALARDEELRLLRALDQAKILPRFVVLFLLHTGLRASELTHLYA
jgi:integrase